MGYTESRLPTFEMLEVLTTLGFHEGEQVRSLMSTFDAFGIGWISESREHVSWLGSTDKEIY